MARTLAKFAVGAFLGVIAAFYGAPVLKVAVGYPALLACAGVFVQQRTIEDLQHSDFAYRAELKLVSFVVDRESQTVTANLLGGMLASQIAKYRPSSGCSLGDLPPMAAAAPYVKRASPPSCIPATSARVQAALEAHAIRYPNAKTIAVSVLRASTLEVLGSLKGSFAWAHSDDAMLLGWSMTKSILNALIGIRVRQGKMSLDQKALFPEWCERPGDDRCGISILQLLQMSSGLNFDETYGAFGGATHMLFANNDVAKFAISQGYDKAGKRFYYSSATTNILTAALRNSFDDTEEFATFPRKELFEPLGMSSALIQTDSKGLFIMSSFGFATMCDWLAFGALYARNGRTISGRQILTEDWVRMTTSPSHFAPHGEYGLHWWHPPSNTSKENKPFRHSPILSKQTGLIVASGYHGQSVSVFPQLDIVIARFGLTSVEVDWDLTSLLETVISLSP